MVVVNNSSIGRSIGGGGGNRRNCRVITVEAVVVDSSGVFVLLVKIWRSTPGNSCRLAAVINKERKRELKLIVEYLNQLMEKYPKAK